MACVVLIPICCIFLLENAVKDPRIDRVTGLCRKIVSTFSHSWLRRRNLAIAQKEFKLPEHQLKTECPTRWGSRQEMIQRTLEQLPAISQILNDRKLRHLVPTWQDIEVLVTLYIKTHIFTINWLLTNMCISSELATYYSL